MPRCPVCKTVLSQSAYERALGILGARERHMHKQTERLNEKVRAMKEEARTAKADGVAMERKRTQRLLKGKDHQIRILNERLKQIKRGSTPQTEGLEFEEKLVARLRREFEEDDIQHEGRAGDVLHEIRLSGRRIGLVVYECKRTPSIPTDHIDQAARAKASRRADFAVLVTTGRRRGFTGLADVGGVLVVSPLGVIALASLLREQAKALYRAGLSSAERARALRRLQQFISSPDFRNPIEGVIRTAEQLGRMLVQEAVDHHRTWQRRWDKYQLIAWDSRYVQKSVQKVLQGKPPEAHVALKPVRLALPALKP